MRRTNNHTLALNVIKTVTPIALGAFEYYSCNTVFWTCLFTVVSQFQLIALIHRYIAIDDDRPCTMFVQGIFLILFFLLLLCLVVFCFWISTTDGAQSFHQGMSTWWNPPLDPTQSEPHDPYFGYNGRIDLFQIIKSAYSRPLFLGFWRTMFNSKTKQASNFCASIAAALRQQRADFDFSHGQPCNFCSGQYNTPQTIAQCLAPNLFA